MYTSIIVNQYVNLSQPEANSDLIIIVNKSVAMSLSSTPVVIINKKNRQYALVQLLTSEFTLKPLIWSLFPAEINLEQCHFAMNERFLMITERTVQWVITFNPFNLDKCAINTTLPEMYRVMQSIGNNPDKVVFLAESKNSQAVLRNAGQRNIYVNVIGSDFLVRISTSQKWVPLPSEPILPAQSAPILAFEATDNHLYLFNLSSWKLTRLTFDTLGSIAALQNLSAQGLFIEHANTMDRLMISSDGQYLAVVLSNTILGRSNITTSKVVVYNISTKAAIYSIELECPFAATDFADFITYEGQNLLVIANSKSLLIYNFAGIAWGARPTAYAADLAQIVSAKDQVQNIDVVKGNLLMLHTVNPVGQLGLYFCTIPFEKTLVQRPRRQLPVPPKHSAHSCAALPAAEANLVPASATKVDKKRVLPVPPKYG